MLKMACGVALGALVLVGCHTITEELPTQPTKPPTAGVITVSIPVLADAGKGPTPPPPPPPPGPGPTPTPAPTPTPTPPPGANGCGNPLPEVTRMNTKVHIRGPNLWTLDVTPLVGPDVEYCKKIGFTDGRSFCPVRQEGSPDRVACETYAVGKARDTGRSGPTWYRNGKLCTGQGGDCENHPENQYLLQAYGGGYYEACADDGLCGGVQVDR